MIQIYDKTLNFQYIFDYFRCCRAIMMQGMVFRYTWVYSKEDTMAHTRRPVVSS